MRVRTLDTLSHHLHHRNLDRTGRQAGQNQWRLRLPRAQNEWRSTAWDLRRNLTIGDALYVALARRLPVALVTADDRLSRAPGLRVRVIT
ncbi:MAG: PIN domain-containing protein [Acidimicrobiales bacterium]